jgi:hypothetical protein
VSALPQAVTEHLRVLGIQSDRVTLRSVCMPDDQWIPLWYEEDFSTEKSARLQALGVTRVELRFDGWVSEFEIEELVS